MRRTDVLVAGAEVHVLPAHAKDGRLLALYRRGATVTGVVGVDRARDVMRLRRCLESAAPLTGAVRVVAA
jgi:NAD/ferredoxin-dependent reductase-like protein